MKGIVWGLDYRQTNARRGRWLTVLTRLADGRLLVSWESGHRPVLGDIRQVLGLGLAKFEKPEALWCDLYLSHWCVPYAEHHGVRLHVRGKDVPQPSLVMEPTVKGIAAEPEGAGWWWAFKCLFNREGREGARRV